MKAELQDKLLNKYPHFFNEDVKILSDDFTLNEFVDLLNQETPVIPIQVGFECNEGWYYILVSLFEAIDNHIKNYYRNTEKLFKYSIFNSILNNIPKYSKLYRKLYNLFDKYISRKPLAEFVFQITQIKEKYGTLRVYYYGGDQYVEALIDNAEHMSYYTCEFCGATKNVGQTKGWIYTICKDCALNDKRINIENWIPIK